jgi:hypothetical protein
MLKPRQLRPLTEGLEVGPPAKLRARVERSLHRAGPTGGLAELGFLSVVVMGDHRQLWRVTHARRNHCGYPAGHRGRWRQTGSARTRQSLANQPEGPFGMIIATRRGEWMQIDSTPFDVAVRLGPGDLTTTQPGLRQLPAMRNPVIGDCGRSRTDLFLGVGVDRPVGRCHTVDVLGDVARHDALTLGIGKHLRRGGAELVHRGGRPFPPAEAGWTSRNE